MSDPVPFATDPPEFHTDLSVGEILRRTRLHYGQSLEQISQVLRIRASQLEALETGHVEQLPGRVYAIGFVRAYAEYLGLDGDKMVHLFKNQSVGKSATRPDLHFPVTASESKIPTLAIVGGGLFLCVLVIVIGFVFFTGKKEAEVIATLPDAMQEQVLGEAPAIVTTDIIPPQPPPMFNEEPPVQETGAKAAPASAARVKVNIVENSWVEIRNAKGKVLISQVLKTGDYFLVPDEPGMTLSTGNAGGLSFVVDGKEAPKIGKAAEVKRNVSLNPEDLVKR